MAYYPPGTLIPSKHHLCTARSRVFPFLALPAEIRNRTYDLLFENCLVEVTSGGNSSIDNDTPNQITTNKPEVRKPLEKKSRRDICRKSSKKDSKQLGRDPQKVFKRHKKGTQASLQMESRVMMPVGPARPAQSPRSVHGYQIPFKFLFSSRQIYKEALGVMYSKTAFRFLEDEIIDRFLFLTPVGALQAIQALDISHVISEEPELTVDRKFKLMADRRWLRTCKEIRDKLSGLKTLRLHLQLNDWPSQLGLQEGWARAVLQLRGNGLFRVDAELHHFAFGEERLREVGRKLEIAMMSKEGQLAKAEHDRAVVEAEQRRKNMQARAPRVLVIKMGNASTYLSPG